MNAALALALERLAARAGYEHPAVILARKPTPKKIPYWWTKD